jgi:hypothetical protein
MSQVLSGYQRKPGWIGILDKTGETLSTGARPAGKSRGGGVGTAFPVVGSALPLVGCALPLVGFALPLVAGSDTVPP